MAVSSVTRHVLYVSFEFRVNGWFPSITSYHIHHTSMFHHVGMPCNSFRHAGVTMLVKRIPICIACIANFQEKITSGGHWDVKSKPTTRCADGGYADLFDGL